MASSKDSLRDYSYLVFDTETATLAGSTPKETRIVEIGWVVVNSGKIVERKSFVLGWDDYMDFKLRPKIKISIPELRDGINIKDVLSEFFLAARKCDAIVGHNPNYDVRVLLAGARLYSDELFAEAKELFTHSKLIDTLKLARRLHPELSSHKLKELMKIFDVPETVPRHRAENDSFYTAHCMGHMFRGLRERFGVKSVSEVVDFQESKISKDSKE